MKQPTHAIPNLKVKKEKKKYHSHSVVIDVIEEVFYICIRSRGRSLFVITGIHCMCIEPTSSVLTSQLLNHLLLMPN